MLEIEHVEDLAHFLRQLPPIFAQVFWVFVEFGSVGGGVEGVAAVGGIGVDKVGGDPDAGAVEGGEGFRGGLEAREDLDGGGSGADDGHVFAFEGVVFVPGGRVDKLAAVLLEIFDFGPFVVAVVVENGKHGPREIRIRYEGIAYFKAPLALIKTSADSSKTLPVARSSTSIAQESISDIHLADRILCLRLIRSYKLCFAAKER